MPKPKRAIKNDFDALVWAAESMLRESFVGKLAARCDLDESEQIVAGELLDDLGAWLGLPRECEPEPVKLLPRSRSKIVYHPCGQISHPGEPWPEKKPRRRRKKTG